MVKQETASIFKIDRKTEGINMFFKRNEGQFRETDRVTRFKLIKSGKHWLRASTSLFGLFKVIRGGVDIAQVSTEVVEERSSTPLTGIDVLKGIVALSVAERSFKHRFMLVNKLLLKKLLRRMVRSLLRIK